MEPLREGLVWWLLPAYSLFIYRSGKGRVTVQGSRVRSTVRVLRHLCKGTAFICSTKQPNALGRCTCSMPAGWACKVSFKGAFLLWREHTQPPWAAKGLQVHHPCANSPRGQPWDNHLISFSLYFPACRTADGVIILTICYFTRCLVDQVVQERWKRVPCYSTVHSVLSHSPIYSLHNTMMRSCYTHFTEKNEAQVLLPCHTARSQKCWDWTWTIY